MKIIAMANHKGGVGKTTSVASIGSALATKGRRVLLIDLDAQLNLSTCFLKEQAEELEVTVYDALMGRATLPIIHIGENLDLVPASIELAKADIDLSSRLAREGILRELLEDVKGNYDYILLDCPPSLGLVTTNALTAATDVYIPLTAEALPFRGLNMLDDIVREVSQSVNRKLKVSGVIVTRYNSTRALNKAILEEILKRYGEKVFNTKIHENVKLAEAPLTGKSIFNYKRNSRGAMDYDALTDEIIAREKIGT